MEVTVTIPDEFVEQLIPPGSDASRVVLEKLVEPAATSLRVFRLSLVTSEAVLTEVFHLLKRLRVDFEGAWRFIDSGTVVAATIGTDELPEIHTLMTRYADRPMDFADATLVYLAKRKNLSTIFTVDRNDFAIYRD